MEKVLHTLSIYSGKGTVRDFPRVSLRGGGGGKRDTALAPFENGIAKASPSLIYHSGAAGSDIH